MTALLFAGQGSQYVGMTRDLVERFDVARELAERANAVVGYDLATIMTAGPEETLRETRYTQPALFVHEAILLACTSVGANAAAVAGHSLGEYSALLAAGVLDFEAALSIVQLRANLMYSAGERIPGTMAAVVGLSDDVVRDICAEHDDPSGDRIVPANYNAPGQVVVSGSAERVRATMPVFKAAGARMVKELVVSGAFHSPLLAEAEQPLAERIRATPFQDATTPVYVNVSGEPLRHGVELQEAAIRQLTSPVLWTQTLQRMWADGMRRFSEVGPGSVLQGLVKRTLPEAQFGGLDTATDVERFFTEQPS